MAKDEKISITLSFKKDDAALIDVTNQVNGFMETLSKGVDLGIGVNLANSLLAIPGQIKGAIEAGVEYAVTVRNMAIETRTTASSFQVLSLLSAQTGAGINALTAAVQHMSLATEQAVDGNAKMADVFKRLGIDAATFSALSVPQQLQALADAASKAGWSTQSLNDISELLGKRTAPQLTGALRALASEGFGSISQAAVEAGAVLSDQLDSDIAELGNRWKETGQIWKVTGSEFVEYLKPILEAVNAISRGVAQLFQRTLLGVHLIAADIKAVWQTIPQFLRGQMGDNSLGSQIAENIGIAGAYVNAKWNPTVSQKSGGGESATESSAKTAKTAAEMARLTAELDVLKQKADEAAMSAGAKVDDLASRIIAANRAILQYGQTHTGKDDPELLKLEIARERLQVEFETAKKSEERAAKEASAAAARAAKAAAEKADRDAHAASLVAEIPLQERLHDIEKERSLITQSHLLDNITKQQRLNENADDYLKVIQQIVVLERQRLLLAKDPLEKARIEAEIGRLQNGALTYGAREQPVSREQQAAAAYGKLGDPTQHFQTAGGGLMAGLQEQATRIGTIGDQINAKFQNIAQTITGSVSSGIEGLINHTQSWKQALANVASAIEGAIINAIVQMGVEWVTQQIMMAVVGKSIAAASLAANAGIAMAQSAIWAAPATLATIASFGGAAVAAPVEIAGAMLATQGLALASDGGVFDGDPSKPRGIFHGGEGVLTARTMSMPGMASMVNALNSGNQLAAMSALSGSAVRNLVSRSNGLASARGSAGKSTVGILVSDDRPTLMRQLQSTQGQKTIMQSVRNSRGMLFA